MAWHHTTNNLKMLRLSPVYPGLPVCTPEQLKRAEASRACPRALHLVRNQVGFDQSLLLGSQRDMENILEAVERIRNHAGELMKT